MEVDKKAAGGEIKFVMCEGIGKTRFHWLGAERNLARARCLARLSKASGKQESSDGEETENSDPQRTQSKSFGQLVSRRYMAS